ncbi:MAG: hypothetical protein QGG64_16880 [Candidatus Latescibacteria bacterium]|jgi:Fe2+ or Zn2+ uptake regulation protein|nr:hypothetical protein [Candidatus Latescibacterota bacterium]|tara:strand:- start:124 stop:348 length:225 start_codon:yes stop_codon:yes gene_type:complete
MKNQESKAETRFLSINQTKESIVTEERLKILEILQEGKINAEEALQLLEALKRSPGDGDKKRVVKVRVEKQEDD